MNTKVRTVLNVASMCLVLAACVFFLTYLLFTIQIKSSALILHRQTAGFFLSLLDERMRILGAGENAEDAPLFIDIVSSLADYYDLDSPERIVVFNRDTGRVLYPVTSAERNVGDAILFGTRNRVEGVLDIGDRYGYFVRFGAGPLVIYSYSRLSDIARYRNSLVYFLAGILVLFTLFLLLYQRRLLRRWFDFLHGMKGRFGDVAQGKTPLQTGNEDGYGLELNDFISEYNRMARRIGSTERRSDEKLRNLFKQRDSLRKLVFLYKKYIPDKTLRKLDENEVEEVVSTRTEVSSLSVEIIDFLEHTHLLYPQVITSELDALHDFVKRSVGGIINYSRGYGFNVIFGVPGLHGQSAGGAEAAKKIIDWIEERNRSERNLSGIAWNVRFGLARGSAVTGIVGNSYTVIGDVIDRSEEMLRSARFFNVFLVTDETGIREDSALKHRMLDKPEGGGNAVYEIFLKENEKLEQAVRIYGHGLEMYQENRFDMAVMDFKKVDAIFEGDGPSRVFLGRCERKMRS